MEPTLLDANRPNKWKIKRGLSKLQSTRQKAVQLVSGGSGKHPVPWRRFFQPTTMESVAIITSELYGWIIDLMVLFIEKTLLRVFGQFSPASFKYVMDFTVVPGQKLQTKRRYVKGTEFTEYAAYVFLMTFVQSDNTEAVGLLYFEENDIEVFFPFPHAFAADSGIKRSIEEIITFVSRNWTHAQDRNMRIRWFEFLPAFPDSNVWIPYYLLLRQTESLPDVQKLFLDGAEMQLKLNEKSFFTYKRLGKLISRCVQFAAKQGNTAAMGERGAYQMFFSNQSKSPVTMDDGRLDHMHEFFALCDLPPEDVNAALNDIQPLRQLPASQDWPEFKSESDREKWERFVPSKRAVTMTVYF